MVSDGDSFAPPVRRRMGRGVAFLTAASAAFVVSGYAVNVWLGRLLGPEEYGRFAVVIAVMTLLNVVQNASVPQALARIVARDPRTASAELRIALSLQLGFGILLAALLFTAAAAVAHSLGDPRLEESLRAAAIVVPPYGVFTVLVAYQNGLARHGRQAAGQITYAIAKVVGAVGLAYPLRATGAALGYGVAAVAGAIVVAARPSWRRPHSRPTDLLSFAAPHAAYALATMGQFSVDILLVMALASDPDASGIYAAAQSIARIPYFLLAGLAVLLLPGVAAAVRIDRHSATGTVRQAIRLSALIVLPVVAIVVASSGGVLELLYGGPYASGTALLGVLSIGMGALAIGSVAGAALSGLGHPGQAAAFAVVGLAITITGSVVLVPVIGPVGASAAMSCGALASLVLVLFRISHVLPGALPYASMARVSAASLTGAAIVFAVSPEGPTLVLVGLAALVIAYAALTVVGELGPNDAERIRGVFRGT